MVCLPQLTNMKSQKDKVHKKCMKENSILRWILFLLALLSTSCFSIVLSLDRTPDPDRKAQQDAYLDDPFNLASVSHLFTSSTEYDMKASVS